MASSWKFYKAELLQSFPSDKFLSGELVGPGFGSTSINQVTEALEWKTYNPVNQTANSFQWKTYNPVSQDMDSLSWPIQALLSVDFDPFEWVIYSTVDQTFDTSWIVYLEVNTDFNRKKFYQSEGFFDGRKKYYKSQLFSSDFLNNTLYWETGFPATTFEWIVGGHPSQTQQLSWLSGGSVRNSKLFRWTAGGLISNSKQFRWGVNGVINMAFDLTAYKFNRYRVPNNVNYQKYKILSISNTGTSPLKKGSTVEFEFNHQAMVSAGEADEYGDHFRITWVPIDRAEQEIDAEIINPNTTNTKIRFKTQQDIPVDGTVLTYRLYYDVIQPLLFEETYRDKKNVYYFYANSLSSNVALVNGTFTSESTGIQRIDDTNSSSIGFNVPDDGETEVEFRFLDDGENDSSIFIGIEWRGDGNSSRTFKLDNDNGTTNNQIANYDNGTGFTSLGSSVDNIKTIPAKMGVKVKGDQVELYLNDTLLDTVTDATASTGGMRIIFSPGASVLIHSLRVRESISDYTVSIGTPVSQIKQIPSSHKVMLGNGLLTNTQCTVLRLKRHPNNVYTLETMDTIGEWGTVLPSTKDQTNSLEIHLVPRGNELLANVMELNT